MTFADWYKIYRRDEGELMPFNSIDLESAYNAGVESVNKLPLRAMFDAGFEAGLKEVA